MAKKKLLSLEDLYEFYAKQNKDVRFSSKDDDTSVVVHINEPYKFSKDFDDELNLLTHLRFCHTEDNVNRSNISKESMEDAMPTAYNMPILGYIYKNDDDEYVFAGHEFYEDENGETVYEEIPIGCIPESADLKLVYDEKVKKYYLEGNGIIWRTYTKAAEILEREEDLSVSIEITIDEMSYSAKNKVLNIEKFRFIGVTILQEDRETGKEIKPGMTGAEISIMDFSAEKNSVFTQELINELRKFNENFAALNENKQGGQSEMNLFEELLAKYNVTAEQVKFDYSELSDEELEKAFAEAFGEENPEGGAEPENDPEGGEPEDGQGSEDDDDDDDPADAGNDDNGEDDGEKYSLTLPDGTVKTFSLSMDEIQYALYSLINDTYSELDNDYYDVTVYPDDSKVVMYSWWSGNAYRQSYKRKKDNFSLEGERVAVHRQWLSDDEQKALDDMKANYSAIESKLENYEAEPEKVELLQSAEYDGIKSTKEYEELSKRESYFELSKEDLAKKLDEITLSYAKKNALNFAKADKPENKTIGMKVLPVDSNKGKRGRYGGIFSKEN